MWKVGILLSLVLITKIVVLTNCSTNTHWSFKEIYNAPNVTLYWIYNFWPPPLTLSGAPGLPCAALSKFEKASAKFLAASCSLFPSSSSSIRAAIIWIPFVSSSRLDELEKLAKQVRRGAFVHRLLNCKRIVWNCWSHLDCTGKDNLKYLESNGNCEIRILNLHSIHGSACFVVTGFVWLPCAGKQTLTNPCIIPAYWVSSVTDGGERECREKNVPW